MHKDTKTYSGNIEIVNRGSLNTIEDRWLWRMLHAINNELSDYFDFEGYDEHSYKMLEYDEVLNPVKFPDFKEGRLSRRDNIGVYLHTTNSDELVDMVGRALLDFALPPSGLEPQVVNGLKLKLNYTKVTYDRGFPVIWEVETDVSLEYTKKEGLFLMSRITRTTRVEYSSKDFLFHSDIYVFDTYSYEGVYFLFEFISNMVVNPSRYPYYQFQSEESIILANIFSKHIDNEYNKWTSYDNKIVDNFRLEDLHNTLQVKEGELIGCSREEALRVFEGAAPIILNNMMTKGKM